MTAWTRLVGGIGAAASLTAGLAVASVALAVPAAAQPCTGNTDAPVSTDADPAGWDFSESGSAGHHEWVEGGLRIFTDEGPATAEHQVVGRVALGGTPEEPLTVLLPDLPEPSWVYGDGSGTEPGLNITLFTVTTNGTPAFAGTLVLEAARGDVWWATREIPGMQGDNSRPAVGTWEQFQTQPTIPLFAVAAGFSLGSPAVGDWIVRSINANCTTWTFDLETPSPSPSPTPTPTPTPSPTPTPDIPGPVPDSALTPQEEGDIQAPATVPAGAEFLVFVGREFAGETVFVYLHSTPIFLGEFVVRDDGTILVQAPPGVTGLHRVVVLDENGEVIGWDYVLLTGTNVVPGGLTGVDERQPPLGPGFAAGAAVVLAAGVLCASRLVSRRRAEVTDAG